MCGAGWVSTNVDEWVADALLLGRRDGARAYLLFLLNGVKTHISSSYLAEDEKLPFCPSVVAGAGGVGGNGVRRPTCAWHDI